MIIDTSKLIPKKGPMARLLLGCAIFVAGFFGDLALTRIVSAAFSTPMDGGPAVFFGIVLLVVIVVSFVMALHDVDTGGDTDYGGPG